MPKRYWRRRARLPADGAQSLSHPDRLPRRLYRGTEPKAALAAWGSDKDLFARGDAEIVTDSALTAEPLARPGEVIKRLRATAEEQIAAAPPATAKPRTAKQTQAKPKPPRPDHGMVEAADHALADAQATQRDAERAFVSEEAALAERRRAMRATHEDKITRLEAVRDAAERAYADALSAWQAS